MLRQWRQTHKSLGHTPGDIWSLRNPTPLIYCPAFKVTSVRERATATPPSERRFSINRRLWLAFLVIDLFNTPYTLLRSQHPSFDREKIPVRGVVISESRLPTPTETLRYSVVSAVRCSSFSRYSISKENLTPSLSTSCFPRRVPTMKTPLISFQPARMYTGD